MIRTFAFRLLDRPGFGHFLFEDNSMQNRVGLMLCLSASLLVSYAADAHEKSKTSMGKPTSCAIIIQDMPLDDIARGMPNVRLALSFAHTSSLIAAGKNEELIALYNKAISDARKSQGPHSICEAAVQQNLGDFYIGKSNYKSAESAYRRGIEIMEMPPNKRSHREILAECYEGMGYVYNNKKQYSQALEAFKKWVRIMDDDGLLRRDSNSESYAMGLDRVADAYMKLNNFKAAEPILKRSLEMRKKTYGENGTTTNCVKEQLAKVYEALGRESEVEKFDQDLIQSKRKELGSELGSFFVKCSKMTAASENILPLGATLGPGAEWNQKLFTKEIQRKLGSSPEDASWYKIPNWMAGLWGEIPKGVKVKETDGVLWTDPPPMGFYSGPGPFATRKGFVRGKNGWWHHDVNAVQSAWTQGGSVGSQKLVYTYYQNLVPVINSDGSIKFKMVVLNFEVKPKVAIKANDYSSLFPAARVTRIWQENRISIFQQLRPGKYAVYTAEHVYDWNGKEQSTTPDGNKVYRLGNASWENKAAAAAETNFVARDLKHELKQFLTKRKMFDEIKSLQ